MCHSRRRGSTSRRGATRRTLALALLPLALAACGDGAEGDPLALPVAMSETEVLPRGRVEVVEERCTDEDCQTTCGRAGCTEVEVRCPAIPPVTARVRVTGSGGAGTLVLLTGESGRTLFGNQTDPSVDVFLDRVRDRGLRVAEVGWNGDGVWGLPADSSTFAGAKTLACRAGTLLTWLADNRHQGGVFAAQGNSGGGSQIAFSLAYYGLDEVLDVANISAGPPPCPIGIGGHIDESLNPRCLGGPGEWDEVLEPLRSGDPDLEHPETVVNFFLGADEPDPTIVESFRAHSGAVGAQMKTISIIPNTAHRVFGTARGARSLLEGLEEAFPGA